MEILSIENLFTLAMLVLLQAVLGFDNLLYISLESQRVEPHLQSSLRKWGIGLAVVLRIVLLYALTRLIDLVQGELFSINIPGVVEANFSFHAFIVLVGGVFLLYTATKEISHMMVLEEEEHADRAPRSYFVSLVWIVAMNAVFSFDSILSAMALTDVFVVMATAIVIGGILMIVLADRVTEFLKRNRMYEVVGLFILFLVAVMLLSEGGHLAHLKLFGFEITPMSKATFYFVIAVMITVDLVQTRYMKKLQMMRAKAAKALQDA